jgi:dihydrofolate synthase/folylpolyglutamate synthase
MGLHPKIIDLTLDRVDRLLERMGRPQDQLPPVVHVAGTNGKGSTIAFLRAILEQAGYRVHVYTSPHLVRFAERIRLAGEIIAEDHLSAILESAEQDNGGEPITFFEITTCAALKAFAETPADILLLEVGLGGRLDATNVVAKPACTVITPVSMDHTQYLGGDLHAIAGEKAAIQKKDVPSVVAPQDPIAAAVIAAAAERAGTRIIEAQPLPKDTPLGLIGPHQSINAGAACAAIDVLRQAGFTVTDADIAAGLAGAVWPARLQRLTSGPIPALLGPDWEVWLDGGHNAAAGETLAAHAAKAWQGKPLHMIAGMLNTKTPEGFLAPFAGQAESVATIAIPGEANSLSAEDLCETALSVGVTAHAAESLEKATAALKGRPPGILLICGSLYLAGEVLADNS